ncbi:MAG: DMT family transporter [Thiobacillaceae bacterium]|nr:DMT family transporter [Thiobacillaceae bacterium]MCX7673991.1 DMT family transporter [Thiobacillaceae bacterium]
MQRNEHYMRSRSQVAVPHPALPAGALLLAAFTWGVIWYPYRLLETAGISGVWATVLTYAVALALSLPLHAGQALQHSGRWRGLLAVALASGWTNLAYVLAVLEGEVMRVMLLFYLAPLWTVIFARVLLDERPHLLGYGVIGLSLAGAMTMLYPGDGRLPLPANAAEWYGLTAGMGFALANVLSRRLGEVPAGTRSLWVYAGVLAVAGAMLPLAGGSAPDPAAFVGTVWGLTAAVGVALVLATLAVQYGLAHTPAMQAIVILLTELVAAGLSSWWLAGETMGAREWLGGAMIVAASLLSGRMRQPQGT